MNQFTNRMLYLAGAITVIAGLNGCALHKVGITYTPQKNVAEVPGAGNTHVKLEVIDARLIRDRIGALQFRLNDTNATPIIATNDPVMVIQQAIATELVNRGFKLSNDGISLVVHLDNFYGIFATDKNASEITATVQISVRIRNPDGSFAYKRTVTGKAEKEQPQSNLEAAGVFSDALQDCLAHLFADPSLYQCLPERLAHLIIVRRTNSAPPRKNPLSLPLFAFPLSAFHTSHREFFRINLLQMPFLIIQIAPLRRHDMRLGRALILDRGNDVA